MRVEIINSGNCLKELEIRHSAGWRWLPYEPVQFSVGSNQRWEIRSQKVEECVENKKSGDTNIDHSLKKLDSKKKDKAYSWSWRGKL